MVWRRWSARAAANKIASACGPNGFAAPESSTWRIASAPAEPPGSRLTTTPRPSDCRRFASSDTCVDLPAPSPPSKVMNFPRIGPSLLGRHAGHHEVLRKTGIHFSWRRSLQPVHAGAEDVDHKLAHCVECALVQAAAADVLARLEGDLEHDI